MFLLAAAFVFLGCQPATPPVVDSLSQIEPTATETNTDQRCRFGGLPNSLTFRDPVDDAPDWQFSTHEESGMDTDLLAQGLETLDQYPALYSILIIRNDHIVYEKYFNGQTKNSSHEIASASKSILSALTGIALREGYLESTSQTLGELLPEILKNHKQPDRAHLNLEDLLTMRTGFAWEPQIIGGKSQKDRVSLERILDTPSQVTPDVFLYNTGATHLMSAVISEASGMDICTFAYKYLFDALGITVEWWNQDKDGYFTGGWNMYLTPRELAKFGLLYLHGGEWHGNQILPETWVEDSLSYHTTASSGQDTYYGYWWWLASMWNYDVYSARGGGGQMIYIIPALDLVFVTTSDASYQGQPDIFDSLDFLWQYIIPATTP